MTLAKRYSLPYEVDPEGIGIGIWHCWIGNGYWWEDGHVWFRLTVTP